MKRTIRIGRKINGQLVDSTSQNSEKKIRNRTSVQNLAFLIKHIAC